LPTDALIVASFGIIHPSKGNAEAVEAFAAMARAVPGSLLVFVGEEADDGLARRRAEALGLSGRVRFLGRADDARFLALVKAADVGVSLRRPPTNGETSGALLHLLRSGVPAVVSDTGSFAEYPDGAVRKVPWSVDALAAALLELAADPAARDALGRAGLEHVRARHAWADVAARYAEVIDWSAGGAGALFRGPHRRASATRETEPSERGTS
jgi:glycosyltransferase involved in cell wall biosynthesis